VLAATILDLSQAEQAALLAALRRARYGYLLALHVLLLCAAGKTPTEISDCLFCSRSSVYRIVAAYHAGTLGFSLEADGRLGPPIRTTVLLPWVRRALLALLKRSPRAFGWCRTRWSCALLAAELQARRRVRVSAETIRRWVHEVGWVWKRAKLSGRDDDPERVAKLARIRYAFERLGRRAVMVFADELDIALLPKVGYQWTPKGEQVEVPTPGSNQKNYLAGALELRTGRLTRCVWFRKQAGLFLDLLKLLDGTYPAGPYTRIYVVADNAKIHKAGVVLRWLAEHPRVVLLYLPTYCPRANPIERAFGDVHDNCTRNHKRKRLRDLMSDVEEHFEVNGPWKYKLPSIYYEPEVTAALEKLAAKGEMLAA
jgi:putative transposase